MSWLVEWEFCRDLNCSRKRVLFWHEHFRALDWVLSRKIEPSLVATQHRPLLQDPLVRGMLLQHGFDGTKVLAELLRSGRLHAHAVERPVLASRKVAAKEQTVVRPAESPSSKSSKRKERAPIAWDPETWITIRLIDQDHNPMPGVRYRLTLPDKSVREGTLDDAGIAHIRKILPGDCTVIFPEIDAREWKPI